MESGLLMKSSSPIWSLIATALALLVGLALHFLVVFLRDNGPSFNGISLRGNGALIVLAVALLGLILGEIVAVRRRALLASSCSSTIDDGLPASD